MKKTVLPLLSALVLFACSSSDKGSGDEGTTAKKDSTTIPAEKEKPAEPKHPAIINITDTLSVKRIVLYMKDSAASMERLQMKLGEIYGARLDAVIKKNKLKVTGPPMAWYRNTKLPYFFEAGFPVDKKPSKLPSNVFVRETGVDSVTVAHFYGGYELLPQAYEALTDWMKSHKKKPGGKPYEVYVDDPMDKDGKMKDPYKVGTDVVFPWK